MAHLVKLLILVFGSSCDLRVVRLSRACPSLGVDSISAGPLPAWACELTCAHFLSQKNPSVIPCHSVSCLSAVLCSGDSAVSISYWKSHLKPLARVSQRIYTHTSL